MKAFSQLVKITILFVVLITLIVQPAHATDSGAYDCQHCYQSMDSVRSLIGLDGLQLSLGASWARLALSLVKIVTAAVLLVATVNLIGIRVARGTLLGGSYLIDIALVLLGGTIIYLIGLPIAQLESAIFNQTERVAVVVLALVIYLVKSTAPAKLPTLLASFRNQRRALTVKSAVAKHHRAMVW